MANKIVQLEDKNNDNIFPIAGGVKDDSVTTAMIKGSAVTSDKIDYTTLKRWVPDYANKSATNLASNNTATITETGFAYISIRGYSTSGSYEANISVNGQEIYYQIIEALSPTSARALYTGFTIPVAAGDVITATRGLNAVNFIPGRWV